MSKLTLENSLPLTEAHFAEKDRNCDLQTSPPKTTKLDHSPSVSSPEPSGWSEEDEISDARDESKNQQTDNNDGDGDIHNTHTDTSPQRDTTESKQCHRKIITDYDDREDAIVSVHTDKDDINRHPIASWLKVLLCD